ncbi:MAG: hypothetical protein ABH821_01790 [archaeon]
MKEKIVVFDKKSKKQVIEAFNKETDSEGFIVERGSSERVLTSNGEEVKFSDFAGLKKGSEIFIKSQITSLLEFAHKEK